MPTASNHNTLVDNHGSLDIVVFHPISKYTNTNTEKGVSQYIPELRDAGHNVTLLIFKSEGNRGKDISIEGVTVEKIPKGADSGIITAARYIFNSNADLLISQFFFQKRYLLWSIVAWLRGIKCITMIDHTPGFPPLTPSIRRKHRIKLLSLALTNKYLYAKSRESIDELVDICPRLQGKIEVLPSGVKRRYFDVDGTETKTIVYVGRLGGDKDTDTLVEAFNLISDNHPDWTLEVAGTGKNYSYIDNDNIQFHGFLDKDKVLDLYSRADIFCLPSLHESFSNVLIEAAAAQTAIVSTDVGVAPELTENAGMLFEKSNPDDLAEKLEQYITKPEKRRSDAHELRDVAKDYEISNASAPLLRRIEGVAKKSGR